MNINLKLSPDVVQRLGDRAAQQGQTLEGLLEKLAEHEATVGINGKTADRPYQDDDDRPWRGVFELDYPRHNIFAIERQVSTNALPPLPTEIHVHTRRLSDDSE